MTENEAIEMLNNIQVDTRDLKHALKCSDLIETAIKALEEVQEYRKIGTLAQVEEATEKNKPKKPDYEGDGYSDGEIAYDTWICPNCGVKYEVDYEEYDYCPDCGQKIDWSVNDEENKPHQEQEQSKEKRNE